jgi:hypothetical protein
MHLLMSDDIVSCRNPGAVTVEDAVEKALFEAGCIPKAHFGDLHSVRAALQE